MIQLIYYLPNRETGDCNAQLPYKGFSIIMEKEQARLLPIIDSGEVSHLMDSETGKGEVQIWKLTTRRGRVPR